MLVVFIFGAMQAAGGRSLSTAIAGGDFYKITSHEVLVLTFGAVGLFVAIALGIGLLRFWRDIGEQPSDLFNASALTQPSRKCSAGSIWMTAAGDAHIRKRRVRNRGAGSII